MNTFLIIILGILLFEYVLTIIVESLNLSRITSDLPQEFHNIYDKDKYRKSQEYLKDSTKFKFISSTFFTIITVFFILMGGFNVVDQWVRGIVYGEIMRGLLFAGILMIVLKLIHIPFSLYGTFVIEEKYGFNKTTPKTFITDFIKRLIIGFIISGIIFSVMIWFFATTGSTAWIWCWIAIILFQIFLMYISPVVIMPLFNKFIPLEGGSLKEAIFDFAGKQKFALKDIFKIDGSRRSTKANAFFTGFGKNRRIALYDTLIEQHSETELVSILAHEIGHYKKKHMIRHLVLMIATTGLMLYLLGFFINNQMLFDAFKMESLSIYASLIFFGFLYSPINMIFSTISRSMSRMYEYEADRYAVESYRNPEAMISGLKKLSVNTLSNLTPHPAKVFIQYTHPPVLKRIEAIRNIKLA